MKYTLEISRFSNNASSPISLAAVCVFINSFALNAEEPWRLADALALNEDFTLSGNYRVRYEHLDGQFRASLTGADNILVERLALAAEYRPGPFYIGAELQDSRAQLADGQTPIGTDDVNVFEFLKAYIGYRKENVFKQNDTLDTSFGRLTLNIGSRRLSARNGFRNTVNSFLGIYSDWQNGETQRLQVFATLPTHRLPNDVPSLLNNEIALDKEDFGTVFWGAHYTEHSVVNGVSLEAYFFGLNEQDLTSRQTRNRDIYTPGFRLLKKAAPEAIDFEVEFAYQFGHSRVTALPSAPRLDHSAYTYHTQVGYTLDDTWQTRLSLQYDAASGDNDPFDNDNGRFNRLFGIPRFEFGPTGLFGVAARSNLRTPGARIEIKPLENLDMFAAYRLLSLDSARDALTTAGLQDVSGASGKRLGSQFEVRVRYEVAPGNVRLEVGSAYLAKGQFLRSVPDAIDRRDSAYVYGQVLFSF